MARFNTLDEFIERLPALAAGGSDKLKGHDGSYCLETRQGRTVYVQVRDGQVTLPERLEAEPRCTVRADEGDLLQIINGSLNPVTAILFGRVKIKGDKGSLLELARLMR